MSKVTFEIACTESNLSIINEVTRLIAGAQPLDVAVKSEELKPSAKTEQKEEPRVSLTDVKNAAKKAKLAHGEDFANGILDSFDVKAASSLGRRMSSVDESDYQAIIDAWAAGPQTELAHYEPEDMEDMEDELEDDVPTVDPEAVKTALKAYAKETGRDEAMELMTKYGIKALSKVAEAPAEKLAALLAELV